MEIGLDFEMDLDIPDKVFKQIQDLALSRIGLNLTENKKAMVASRFRRIMQTCGFASYEKYLDYVGQDPSGKALAELYNALTTNHTYFNREAVHFEYFAQQVLPEVLETLRKRGERDLRIWCAGCSSGEEAYFLAMVIMEGLGLDYPDWQADVLATDISQRALAAAEEGVYAEENVKKLPAQFQEKYLQKVNNGEWKLRENVRKQVVFRTLNLMNTRFPFRKPFQIIFCRNVMIYFTPKIRNELVKKFYDQTEAGGYLFLGLSETIARDTIPYVSVMPSVYQKPRKHPQ